MTGSNNLVAFRGVAPRVDPSAWVAPTAVLIGEVEIASDASVFYGSVVRADQALIRIGRGSNLQDLVAVHADPDFPVTVGSGVSVGHGAILHGCTIEDDCLIGMGATILNGATIGTGSLIAAGALVLGGTIIPPGSMVAGSPGTVRRQLTENDLTGVRQNAEHYVDLAREHSLIWRDRDSVAATPTDNRA